VSFLFCAYSGRRDTLFELLNATSPQDFLLWYKNFPIENALRELKIGVKRESSHRIFTPSKLDLTFRAPNHCAKFHQNRIKIAPVGVFTDGMTEMIS